MSVADAKGTLYSFLITSNTYYPGENSAAGLSGHEGFYPVQQLRRQRMNKYSEDILRNFALDSEPVYCEKYGHSHINETCLVVCRSERRYILQKINAGAFRDVEGLMENIS